MTQPDEAPRLWAGTTLAERRSGRRARLLQAGVALIAAGGGPAMTVRAVCRESGLTARYFYEHFEDRDEFANAVYQSVADECEAAIRSAVAATAGRPAAVAAAVVDAVVGVTVDSPDKGRVMFVAPGTDPVLFAARDRFTPVVTALIAEQVPRRDSPEVRQLKSASLLGALSHTFFLYVDGRLDVTREAFVSHCVELLVAVAGMPGR